MLQSLGSAVAWKMEASLSATVLPIAVPLAMVQLSAMAVVLSAVAVVTSKWAVAPLSAAVALSTVAASKD